MSSNGHVTDVRHLNLQPGGRHGNQADVARLNDQQVRLALRLMARCVYCGNYTKRMAVPACHRHRKLVALDPYYTPTKEA